MNKDIKTALVTGSSARIGAEIIRVLHKNNYQVIIHCNNSKEIADQLCNDLNNLRENSAKVIVGDLSNIESIDMINDSIDSLDLLVNNASVFYPNSIGESSPEHWDSILNVNLKAPFFLAKSLSEKLSSQNGSIINIIDIHAERPLEKHAIYNISKAGLKMLTQTLAKELAPSIRVNGVSPGSILWPEHDAQLTDDDKNLMLKKIPLNSQGSPKDIADTVLFLANANYITGQTINVDGGRTLAQ